MTCEEKFPEEWLTFVILVTWEAEIRRIEFQASLTKKFTRPHLNGKKLKMAVCSCHPSNGEKCKVGGSQSRPRPYLQNNQGKMCWRCGLSSSRSA
jgi:hypothetical protein